MDLNYLLARHQTALVCADRATCVPSRNVHRALASGYAARIVDMQQRSGASALLSAAPMGGTWG